MNSSAKILCLVALICLLAVTTEAQWYGGYGYGGYPSSYGGYYGGYGYPYGGAYGYGGYGAYGGYGGWYKREAGFPQQQPQQPQQQLSGNKQ
ncbi:unnamed protein product, partial [Mesorhabditis belari]|uniref:Uncharacterized protein n=1 Tax=Mesorhabditis belari TaxID=2138241 RepID=A0AAF3EXJ8_9BILA